MSDISASEATFRSLLEAAPDAFVVVDAEGLIRLVNAQAEALFGYETRELVGTAVDALVPERFRARHEGHRQAFFAAPKTRPMGAGLDLFACRKDGSEFPAEISLAAVETPRGRLVSAVIRDVTERRRVEQALRASEARLRAVLEAAPDAFVEMDVEGLITEWNPRAEAMFGWRRAEALGRSVAELLIPVAHRPAHARGLQRFLTTGEGPILGRRLELSALHQAGHTLPVELRVTAIPTGAGGYRFTAFLQDLSERHRAQQTRARLAAIVDSSQDAIIGTSLDGLVTSWNAGAERLFGYPAAEMIGRPITVIYPDSRLSEESALHAKILSGERVARFETVRRTRDGRALDVSLSLSPIRADDGTVVGVSRVSHDITDRKLAEAALARAKEAAEASSRELEAFSYSVAHDLRAPLRGIDGFSQALIEEYGQLLDANGLRYLDRVRESAQHMGELIDSLLKLARITQGELKRERVDLGALARAALVRLGAVEPARQVRAEVAEGLVCEGDSRLLSIVLDNLVSNAWKFTAHTASACIEFGRQASGEQAFFVRDNGAGFDMAFAGRLFGVFQRLHTQREFEGHGIGLATVQRIVRRHGGRIWAEARVGEGATFFFTLDPREPHP